VGKQLYSLTSILPIWERILLRLSFVLFFLGIGLIILGGITTTVALLFQPIETKSIARQLNAMDNHNGLNCSIGNDCNPVHFTIKPANHTQSTAISAKPSIIIKALPPQELLLPQSPTMYEPSCFACLEMQNNEPTILGDTLVITTNTTKLSDRWAPLQKLNQLVKSNQPEPEAETPVKNETTTTVELFSEPEVTAHGCATVSNAVYEVIPIDGGGIDHPDYAHADLNLNLRGFVAVQAPTDLVYYNGQTDSDAPQLAGLLPHRGVQISTVYQVRDWQWGCGSHGCMGEAITQWPVSLIGVATSPGESIYLPRRRADIYQGRLKALVLYADDHQITVGYTRQDSIVGGYAIHVQGICVDANLLALYRAQNNVEGWRQSGLLPALGDNQSFGQALGHEIQVAVRDNGMFMDPRSQKDWWQ